MSQDGSPGKKGSKLPAVCTCDHPDLDPTPRPAHQYDSVKRVRTASAGVARARERAKERKKHTYVSQAIAAAAEDSAYIASEIRRYENEGIAVRTASLQFSQDVVSSSALGSLEQRPDRSASRLALEAWQAERRRGERGLGTSDRQMRHRYLMHRRAAAGTDGDGEGARGGNHEEETLAAARAAHLREEQRVGRLTESPPARFWWILMFWVLGGVVGLHRAALGRCRFALAQLACVTGGSVLIGFAVGLLHPKRTPPSRYPYVESFYVLSLAAGFFAVAVANWMWDGYMLARGGRVRLHVPAVVASARVVGPAVTASATAERPAAVGQDGAAAPGCRRRSTTTRAQIRSAGGAGSNGITREDEHASFADCRLLCVWLVGGLPFAWHRWRLGHWSAAVLHCVLTASATLLGYVGAFGTLPSAFGVCVGLGSALCCASATAAIRDVIQMFRGRLGARKAAAPEYWLLLLGFLTLGTLGFHRILLRRYRSAGLFPLLLCISLPLLMDGIGGFTWGGFPEPTSRNAVRIPELVVGTVTFTVLLAAMGRDLVSLLRGRLKPKVESELYWQVWKSAPPLSRLPACCVAASQAGAGAMFAGPVWLGHRRPRVRRASCHRIQVLLADLRAAQPVWLWAAHDGGGMVPPERRRPQHRPDIVCVLDGECRPWT